MLVCGRHFSIELLERIQAAVDAEPLLSRCALSRRVCDWLDWRGPNGQLQAMSCRKALLKLHGLGRICLPDCQTGYSFETRSSKAKRPLPDLPSVSCTLDELGEVEVFPVSSRYAQASSIWKSLMSEYHYLGDGPLCGAQVRYLVRSSQVGWLGGLSFSSATWQLKERDRWIGWSEAARRGHLREVVLNSRFLILPTVEVPNLASYVLAKCLARLAEDWQERYGYEPVLVETFVNPQRFSGSCYRGANWIHLGQTAGGRKAYPNGKISDGPKEIYVFPLREDFQSLLCAKPEVPLGSTPRPENPEDWVEEEFGRVELYSEPLKERLYTVTRDFFAQPGVLVPQACNGSQAKMKGAYRFFDNPKTDMETLIRPHVEATVERIKEHPVVLSVQDSSSLNYSAHPKTEGLGPINTKADGAVGLILHDTMAFTLEGVPLGLLDVQCWARDPEEAGKSDLRKSLPIEEKESFKWLKSYRATAEVQALCPDSMLVSVGDREADIYELFSEAKSNPDGPKLLVRAERSRNRKVDQEHLWDRMSSEPVAGHQEIYIPRKGSRPARTASLEVRHVKVTLTPPQDKNLPPVEVWAVHALEVNPPAGVKEPIEWMLLTTVETTNFEEACERLRWYALRWGIEVYHRVLKSGCRIQDRRLDDADSLKACLAIDMVVAWRVFLLTMQGRETPDIPCDVYLKEEEWKALYATAKGETPPKQPPTLREAVRMIASLGGFLGRKGDGEPGTTTMWRGLQRLTDIVWGYAAATHLFTSGRSP